MLLLLSPLFYLSDRSVFFVLIKSVRTDHNLLSEFSLAFTQQILSFDSWLLITVENDHYPITILKTFKIQSSSQIRVLIFLCSQLNSDSSHTFPELFMFVLWTFLQTGIGKHPLHSPHSYNFVFFVLETSQPFVVLCHWCLHLQTLQGLECINAISFFFLLFAAIIFRLRESIRELHWIVKTHSSRRPLQVHARIKHFRNLSKPYLSRSLHWTNFITLSCLFSVVVFAQFATLTHHLFPFWCLTLQKDDSLLLSLSNLMWLLLRPCFWALRINTSVNPFRPLSLKHLVLAFDFS